MTAGPVITSIETILEADTDGPKAVLILRITDSWDESQYEKLMQDIVDLVWREKGKA
jgi:hypothetical protein